jgi:hypothetical protein
MTVLLIVTGLAMAGESWAQSEGDVDGLGDLILELSRTTPTPTLQRVQDQLFSGRIDATIIDADGNNTNFEDGDIVAFGLAPVSRTESPLIFTGTRGEFDAWVEANAEDILAILFPGSLNAGASGIDVAQSHSQNFLVSTALAAGGRGNIGGRIEFESFEVEGASGNAIQGLFRAGAFGVEGRYTQLDDTLRTKSTNIGVNVHPGWGRARSGVEWQVGVDGYFNLLYSTSSALDLGSLDFGGGGWASGRVEVPRTSITFGGIFLGSNTYIPPALVDDSFEFVARIINDRALRWDLSYGGAVQYLLTSSLAVGGKILQTRSIKAAVDPGRTSELFLAHVSYLVGGDKALDFGYRYSTGDERYLAHGIFMNANIGF